MVNKTITEFEVLGALEVDEDTDVIPIVDVSESSPSDRNKKISRKNLLSTAAQNSFSDVGTFTKLATVGGSVYASKANYGFYKPSSNSYNIDDAQPGDVGLVSVSINGTFPDVEGSFGWLETQKIYTTSAVIQTLTTGYSSSGVPTTNLQMFKRIRANDGSAWGDWVEFYNSKTSVGTVSESGGVPTGALFESGSNANGSYTRYSDGTQICSFTDVLPWTGSSVTLSKVWTYPAAFLSRPSIILTPMDYRDGGSVAGGNWTGSPLVNLFTRVTGNTSGTLYASREGSWSSGDGVNFHAVAYGRWY